MDQILSFLVAHAPALTVALASIISIPALRVLLAAHDLLRAREATIKNPQLRAISEVATDAMYSAVRATFQVFVSDLRANDGWNEAARIQARKQAEDAFKALLAGRWNEWVASVTPPDASLNGAALNIVAARTTLMESAIHDMKLDQALALQHTQDVADEVNRVTAPTAKP